MLVFENMMCIILSYDSYRFVVRWAIGVCLKHTRRHCQVS